MMRKGHPLASAGRLTLEAFAEAGHVKVGVEGRGVAWIDSMLAARGLERRVVLTVPHFLTVPHVLDRTDLIATMPSRLARRVAGSARVTALEPPLAGPTLTVHIAWHARTHGDPMQVWLRKTIKAVAETI